MYFKCSSNIRLHRPFKVVWSPLIKTFHSIWQSVLVHLLSFFFFQKVKFLVSTPYPVLGSFHLQLFTCLLFRFNPSYSFSPSPTCVYLSTCLTSFFHWLLSRCTSFLSLCYLSPSPPETCLVHLYYNHRVHTEWQWPISGVHSIMMEKNSLAGEGGGCTPTPFHSIYHHVQSCSVHSSWEGRYTPPISSLPLYVLCDYSLLISPDHCLTMHPYQLYVTIYHHA